MKGCVYVKKWNYFSPACLKPSGWLKRQLEIQADGLSGHLDEVWPYVRDSAWIGGNGDNWERFPYWFDGFVPLAYLLNDDAMIAKTQKYIDYIFEHQHDNGWICPCADESIPTYDAWGLIVFSRTLVCYYMCSNDKRVPEVLYKMMKCYYNLLKDGTLTVRNWEWAVSYSRWHEAFHALNLLYETYGEKWIVELGHILKNNGFNHDEFADSWKLPLNECKTETHIVCLSEMLKKEAVCHAILNEEYTDKAEYWYQLLNEYNGMPSGVFTGDEHLNGLSPIQGTELCGVVELMYSFEQLFAYSGHTKWLDRLEKVAFNALPAAISDDMWTHQYDQLSNQISCEIFPRKPIFGSNNNEAHIFGLEPNMGCCTANFSQGWPKFALSAFAYSGNTVMNSVILPSVLKSELCDIEIKTEYPFKHCAVYKIEAHKDFCFKIRIPEGMTSVYVDGKEIDVKKFLSFNFNKNDKASIEVSFATSPKLVNRPHDLKTVEYGPLVFSLPLKYKKVMHEYERQQGPDLVIRKYPYCDYEYVGESDWNYGFDDIVFEVENKDVNEIPFSSFNPPVIIKAKMRKIPWGFEPGYSSVCARIPVSREPYSVQETKELYPYGCAKLRMTEMPLLMSKHNELKKLSNYE